MASSCQVNVIICDNTVVSICSTLIKVVKNLLMQCMQSEIGYCSVEYIVNFSVPLTNKLDCFHLKHNSISVSRLYVRTPDIWLRHGRNRKEI